jgi:hypothetical protein
VRGWSALAGDLPIDTKRWQRQGLCAQSWPGDQQEQQAWRFPFLRPVRRGGFRSAENDMGERFFEEPILNFLSERRTRRWELVDGSQPGEYSGKGEQEQQRSVPLAFKASLREQRGPSKVTHQINTI